MLLCTCGATTLHIHNSHLLYNNINWTYTSTNNLRVIVTNDVPTDYSFVSYCNAHYVCYYIVQTYNVHTLAHNISHTCIQIITLLYFRPVGNALGMVRP